MRRSVVTFAVLAFCIALVAADANSAVIDLDADNFDSFVDGSKPAFVEFFAPWCGHCKKLAPEYEVVAEAFKGQGVVIAKVDCDAHKSVGERFDVHGYPTLKFFPKGSTTPEDYQGGRSADDIVNWINNKVGTKARVKKTPSNVVDLTASNFDSIVLDKSKDVLVEFYAPWCGHCKSLAPDYEKVANAFAAEPNVIVAKIDADGQRGVGEKYEVSGFPTIKWFGKNNKEAPETYDGARDVQSFVDYINTKSGVSRNLQGRLSENAGRVAVLDAVLSKFSAAADKSVLVQELESVVSSLTDSVESASAKLYSKLLATAISKGADFIQNEIARVERLLGGALSPAKVDELTIRKNILAAFK